MTSASGRPFDAVLCDVDGVLRHWPSIEPVELAHGASPGTLYAAAFAPQRLLPAITGGLTDDEWRALVTVDLAESGGLERKVAESLVAAWSAMRPTTDEKVVALLRLARDAMAMPVSLISNATTRLEADLAEAGLSEFIDTAINTSRVGFAKPDPRVYAYAAEYVGVLPSRCLFVDDSAANVEAARDVGMVGVHFRTNADLERVLSADRFFDHGRRDLGDDRSAGGVARSGQRPG